MRSAGFGWAINMLSLEDEAIAVAFRKHTLLPARRLPLCPAGYRPAFGALLFASLLSAPWHQPDKPARKAFRTYPSAGARAFYASRNMGHGFSQAD